MHFPSVSYKGIVNHIPKGNTNPTDPLERRPITLLSIRCKVYAYILNLKLMTWERNDILCEEQNGFQGQRRRLDDIYSLYALIYNLKPVTKFC